MTPEDMDEQLSSLVRYSATDRVYDDPQQTSQKETKPNRPGTPRLALTFRTEPELDTNVQAWHGFPFILTRDADDPQRQSCIIHWDPVEDGFGRGILLLYREPKELQPFQLGPDQLAAKPLAREVSASDPCSKQRTWIITRRDSGLILKARTDAVRMN